MTRILVIIGTLAAAAATCGPAAAQVGRPTAATPALEVRGPGPALVRDAPADGSATIAGYHDRLAALAPSAPVAYLELAEEIAAEVRTGEGRELARRLYVLAILAPRPQNADYAAPSWLASSAALGLAALAENEHDRRWLVALAGTLAPVDAALAHQQPPEAAVRDAAAIELATALGQVRSGDGRRASKTLEKPAVNALLLRYEGLLNPGGISGGAERVRGLAAKFGPCPECRNRRFIKNADGVRLCPTCQGRPGPKLTVEELLGQLRLESLMLNGIQRSWAAQSVADGGAPMRELDPAVLVDVFGIDPAQCYWRGGVWVNSPLTPAPTLAPAPAPAPPAPSSRPGA